MSKQWYFASFAAAQIAREVEKSERIRAKEASSLNEPSTSTVCTCSSIWIGQTYLTAVINICYWQSLIQSWIPEKVFNFQTSRKVWKIEIKSWKNGKKSFIVTTSALQEKFFCADQILFNLACTFAAHHGKSFVPSYFLRSLLITYLITFSLWKKTMEKVSNLYPKMFMNPVFVKAEEFLKQQLKISVNHIVPYFGIFTK